MTLLKQSSSTFLADKWNSFCFSLSFTSLLSEGAFSLDPEPTKYDTPFWAFQTVHTLSQWFYHIFLFVLISMFGSNLQIPISNAFSSPPLLFNIQWGLESSTRIASKCFRQKLCKSLLMVFFPKSPFALFCIPADGHPSSPRRHPESSST